MRLVILRHGQNRNHRDTSVLSILTSGTLIKSRQVGVHVSRISTTSRNLFTCGRYLTKSIGVVGDISQDNQYVHIFLKSKELCCSQCHTWCGNTLYSRVICQVYKQNSSVDRSCLFEGLNEEVGFLEGDTHRCKYNGELLVCAAYSCLSRNLSCQLCMRQTGCREDRKLLTTNQCIQTINGRYTCLNKLFRIASGCRVHWQTVNITAFLWKDFRTIIDRAAQTVKDTSQHILGYTKLHASSQETYFTV